MMATVRVTARRVVSTIALACLGAAAAVAGPIENLKPGEWYEVPNSHLRQVAPCGGTVGGTCSASRGDPSQACYNSYGIYDISHIVWGWNGGAFDTVRDRLLIFGGGHAGWAGNDIYAFDLNTLQWSRVKDSSCLSSSDTSGVTSSESSGYYSDGSPRQGHDYNHIQYVPAIDRFCRFGMIGSSTSGQAGSSTIDCWDFTSHTWERKASPPYALGYSFSAMDAATGHAWVRCNDGNTSGSRLQEWDPVANTWAVRNGNGESNQYLYDMTAAVDTVRRKMIGVGLGYVYSWDVGQSGTITRQALTTSGPQTIVTANAPGFDYDSTNRALVGWDGGATVYTLDLDTNTWTARPPAPTNTVTPTSPDSSDGRPGVTYGRFRYSPLKNVFVVINSVDQNVFIYRLAGVSSSPTSPPPSPANVRTR